MLLGWVIFGCLVRESWCDCSMLRNQDALEGVAVVYAQPLLAELTQLLAEYLVRRSVGTVFCLSLSTKGWYGGSNTSDRPQSSACHSYCKSLYSPGVND